MVAAGHQTWERGDLLALTFDDPEAEASWIVDRIEHLRGAPFRDRPDSEPRGLSWSDCAVLFRSVAKDSEPVVAELRRREIPFVVKGLNRLFDSPEIQAVVGDLPVHGQWDRGRGLESSLGRRQALARKRQLGPGVGRAGGRPRLRRAQATLRLQHPAALPGFPRGARLARAHSARRRQPRRARLLPARQVQPGDLGLRADLLRQQAQVEVRGLRQVARTPGAQLLRGQRRRRRVRHPGRRDHRDRAPGEGATVAGGIPAGAAQEPVPVASHGRRYVAARHPGRGARRPGTVPGYSRGRDTPPIRRRDASAEVSLRDVRACGEQPAAAEAFELLRSHRCAAMGIDRRGADQA